MAIPSKRTHLINKAGRLVIPCNHGKIYEAHHGQHADFLVSLHQHPTLTSMLPALRDRRGPFLEVEWVEARRWSSVTPEQLAKLLHQIHTTSLAGLPSSGFDYWDDFIVPRFLKAASLLDFEHEAMELLESCQAWIGAQPLRLQHPDLTPSNTLRDRKSGLRVIDNELCCLGRTALLDVCNALHPLRPSARIRWLRAYWPVTVPHHVVAALPSLTAAWTARRVGSLMVSGRLKEAQSWMAQYRAGQSRLPLQPACPPEHHRA